MSRQRKICKKFPLQLSLSLCRLQPKAGEFIQVLPSYALRHSCWRLLFMSIALRWNSAMPLVVAVPLITRCWPVMSCGSCWLVSSRLLRLRFIHSRMNSGGFTGVSSSSALGYKIQPSSIVIVIAVGKWNTAAATTTTKESRGRLKSGTTNEITYDHVV